MERNVKDNINGWNISLQRNIHMYSHALSVKKGHLEFSIDCEDLPTEEKTIGIWLHTLDAPENVTKELQSTLFQWANKYDLKFQIYLIKNEFITNKQST